jgi:RNA polymerase sigma factor (TIGR02999 family)
MAAGFAAAERKPPAPQASSILDDACVTILKDDLLLKAPNRAYFFGAMAIAMRRILAQHARTRQTLKRGADLQRISLDCLLDHYEGRRIDVVELNDALERLSIIHERASQVITLRLLGGCTAREVAEQLEVSLTTVEKDTRFARAWLRQQWGETVK